LWCLPETTMAVASTSDAEEIRLAVFDVIPLRDDAATQLGLVGNYYCSENMTRFVEDIVHTRAQLATHQKARADNAQAQTQLWRAARSTLHRARTLQAC